MNIFKTVSLTWWQVSIFKLGMAAAGIAAGTYWSACFANYLSVIVVVAVISLAYTT
ncbi:MAG: hypothetical protein RJB58_2032 [Pseudomonadota bacterium]|jgi:hypothetical protein